MPRPNHSSRPVLAIAIEDRVDAIVHRADETELILFGAPLPEGGNYFEHVHVCLAAVIDELADDAGDNLPAFFDTIASTVVSTCGVVESNRTLLQVPLWHSATQDTVRWRLNGNDREFFDFADVLGELVEEVLTVRRLTWSSEQRARFEGQVFVVNDATANAAFEHDRRAKADSSFNYIKLHNGVNSAAIRRNRHRDGSPLDVSDVGAFTIETSHPEVGHFYPTLHPADAGYDGACPFHGRCLEGLVAVASIRERAASGLPAYRSWALVLARLEQLHEGQELDDRLHRALLEETAPAKGRSLMIELLGHYAGQLVFNLALTSTPEKIVIGGRSAKPAVLEAVRQKVVALACGYPMRRGLTAKEIWGFVESGTASSGEKKYIEAEGALVIARSRARTAEDVDPRPLPNNVTPISKHRAAKQRLQKPLKGGPD